MNKFIAEMVFREGALKDLKDWYIMTDDINGYIDETGDTPLTLAVKVGNFKVVSELIKLGADVSQRNKKGKLPLNISTYCEDEDIRFLLLDNGADPREEDIEGVSAKFLFEIEGLERELDYFKDLCYESNMYFSESNDYYNGQMVQSKLNY